MRDFFISEIKRINQQCYPSHNNHEMLMSIAGQQDGWHIALAWDGTDYRVAYHARGLVGTYLVVKAVVEVTNTDFQVEFETLDKDRVRVVFRANGTVDCTINSMSVRMESIPPLSLSWYLLPETRIFCVNEQLVMQFHPAVVKGVLSDSVALKELLRKADDNGINPEDSAVISNLCVAIIRNLTRADIHTFNTVHEVPEVLVQTLIRTVALIGCNNERLEGIGFSITADLIDLCDKLALLRQTKVRQIETVNT